jgi:hypothetical protein
MYDGCQLLLASAARREVFSLKQPSPQYYAWHAGPDVQWTDFNRKYMDSGNVPNWLTCWLFSPNSRLFIWKVTFSVSILSSEPVFFDGLWSRVHSSYPYPGPFYLFPERTRHRSFIWVPDWSVDSIPVIRAPFPYCTLFMGSKLAYRLRSLVPGSYPGPLQRVLCWHLKLDLFPGFLMFQCSWLSPGLFLGSWPANLFL